MSIRARVVVGVYPGQADRVVLKAAVFAARFDAELVCAWANPNATEFDPYLTAHLTRILIDQNVDWSTRQLTGDPARALGQLAESLRAVMVVVGTRDGTVRGSLQEFFAGSIAMHLAHRQNRPVVVIPLAPVSFDDLPE